MAGKSIQEQFGQEVIDAMARFAKKDIRSAADLEANDFSHVADKDLRKALAETLYGTRWLYKVGLALLASNEEQFAHVRAQIIDYASICEALLADMIVQAHNKKLLKGKQYTYFDMRCTHRMNWHTADPMRSVSRTTFEWRVTVAEQANIISAPLAARLHKLRTRRNTVHLTLKVMMGVKYYAGLAKRTREAMIDLVTESAAWVAVHP